MLGGNRAAPSPDTIIYDLVDGFGWKWSLTDRHEDINVTVGKVTKTNDFRIGPAPAQARGAVRNEVPAFSDVDADIEVADGGEFLDQSAGMSRDLTGVLDEVASDDCIAAW